VNDKCGGGRGSGWKSRGVEERKERIEQRRRKNWGDKGQ
jgi:hypothetical protein